MTDAFRCNDCGEYYDGEPALELYKKQTVNNMRTDYVHLFDLCEGCKMDLEGDE